MKLIIDTNILFSGLMKDSITRKILLSSDFVFYIPDYYLIELYTYNDLLLEKLDSNKEELNNIIELLHDRLIFVPEKEYAGNMKKADEIIGKVDKKDIPFVALTLSIKNDGIWTNDKHFQKKPEIKVYSTREIILIFKKKEMD